MNADKICSKPALLSYPDRPGAPLNGPRVTAVVLTHNSYDTKAGCVEHTVLSLLRQRGAPCDMVIVDNGSSADCRQKLKNFLSERAPRAVLVEANTSVAGARNLGAMAAACDTLLFLDDDCVVLSSDAVQQVREHACVHTHGYGARRDWTLPSGWFEAHAAELSADLANDDARALEAHAGTIEPSLRKKASARCLMRSFIGHFGFVDKALFDRLGGFPEQFSGYGGEDDTLAFLCLQADARFFNLDSIRVVHVNHGLPQDSYLQGTVNLKRHVEVLDRYGVASFDIEKLLYNELETPTLAIQRAKHL